MWALHWNVSFQKKKKRTPNQIGSKSPIIPKEKKNQTHWDFKMSAVHWYFPLLILWSDLRQKLESWHPPILIAEIANGDIVGFKMYPCLDSSISMAMSSF